MSGIIRLLCVHFLPPGHEERDTELSLLIFPAPTLGFLKHYFGTLLTGGNHPFNCSINQTRSPWKVGSLSVCCQVDNWPKMSLDGGDCAAGLIAAPSENSPVIMGFIINVNSSVSGQKMLKNIFLFKQLEYDPPPAVNHPVVFCGPPHHLRCTLQCTADTILSLTTYL